MAKNLDEWQKEATQWLEEARRQVRNPKLSRADKERLRRNINKTQQLLDDLPQTRRLLEAGVPLNEIKRPPDNIKTQGRRNEYLRANLLAWQKKQQEVALEKAKAERKKLEEAVAQGKLDPSVLRPQREKSQGDVVKEIGKRVITEMKKEVLEHRRLFGRPPDWHNRRLQEYQRRLQGALAEEAENG